MARRGSFDTRLAWHYLSTTEKREYRFWRIGSGANAPGAPYWMLQDAGSADPRYSETDVLIPAKKFIERALKSWRRQAKEMVLADIQARLH